MEESFTQQGRQTQQRRGLLAGPRILHRLANWLAHLVQVTQLTEVEQMEAGIHVGALTEQEKEAAGLDPGA